MSKNQINFLIAIAAALLFIPFLGKVHLFDWDEINFAECAREMIVTNDYSSITINFLPFWEKPPLFIWLQAICMNIFGVNEFSARLPNALTGIAYVLVIFNIGRKLHGNTFGLLWVLAFVGSFLPFLYFKSGIIDPLFNLFIFLGITFAIDHFNYKEKKARNMVLSGLMIGLAMMTKGPVAMLIYLLCLGVFMIVKKMKVRPTLGGIVLFFMMSATAGGIWFLIEIANGRFHIIQEFITYQIRLLNTKDAGHGGPFYYHAIVLLIGCFPASIFALRSLFAKDEFTPEQKTFKLWMKILFWVVLILFSIVQTKIVHYSSLCYLPFTYFSAISLYKMYEQKIVINSWMKIVLIVLGSLISIALTAPYFIASYKDKIISSNLIKDSFAVENFKSNVVWQGWEPIIGILLLSGIIGSVLLFNKKRVNQGAIVLFVSCIITAFTAMVIIAPKVEGYSQKAAIEFYDSIKKEDCYVETIYFKSYAHLFYSNKPKPANIQSLNKEWLLHGTIDKPAYFVCKVNRAKDIITNYPNLQELYRKNGFVFWARRP